MYTSRLSFCVGKLIPGFYVGNSAAIQHKKSAYLNLKSTFLSVSYQKSQLPRPLGRLNGSWCGKLTRRRRGFSCGRQPVAVLHSHFRSQALVRADGDADAAWPVVNCAIAE